MLLYFKMIESAVGRDNPSFPWFEKEIWTNDLSLDHARGDLTPGLIRDHVASNETNIPIPM